MLFLFLSSHLVDSPVLYICPHLFLSLCACCSASAGYSNKPTSGYQKKNCFISMKDRKQIMGVGVQRTARFVRGLQFCYHIVMLVRHYKILHTALCTLFSTLSEKIHSAQYQTSAIQQFDHPKF